jgi:hypothetical protein
MGVRTISAALQRIVNIDIRRFNNHMMLPLSLLLPPKKGQRPRDVKVFRDFSHVR